MSLLLILLLGLLGLLLLLFLILLFPLCLDDGSSDAVKIPLTVLADAAAAVVGLLEDTDLLERLADLALDRGRGVCVVRGTVAPSLGTTVELGQGADTDILAEVDVPCDSSCLDCSVVCVQMPIGR